MYVLNISINNATPPNENPGDATDYKSRFGILYLSTVATLTSVYQESTIGVVDGHGFLAYHIKKFLTIHYHQEPEPIMARGHGYDVL